MRDEGRLEDFDSDAARHADACAEGDGRANGGGVVERAPVDRAPVDRAPDVVAKMPRDVDEPEEALRTSESPDDPPPPAVPLADDPGFPVDFVSEHIDELRGLAGRFFARENIDHTDQATGLVNELWIRLTSAESSGAPKPQTHEEFIAIASIAMRHILVDWARKRLARKRGGGVRPCSLQESRVPSASENATDRWAWSLLELENELEVLKSVDPLGAHAFELRYYGGMTNEQIGSRLGLNPRKAGSTVTYACRMLRKRVLSLADSADPIRSHSPP